MDSLSPGGAERQREYQCVDFDNDMPGWTQTVSGGGELWRSSAMARSPAYSLRSGLQPATDGAATIAWSDVGAQTIQSISASVAIAPDLQDWFIPPPPDGVKLFCVAAGTNTTCLYYTLNGHPFSDSELYTGIYIEWVYIGQGAVRDRCRPSVKDLTNLVWNTVTLTVNPNTGAIDTVINGVSATPGCTASRSASGAVATVTVGASTTGSACNNKCAYWKGYFDDIVAIVRR